MHGFLLSGVCMALYHFGKIYGGLKLFPSLCNLCLSFLLPTVFTGGHSGVNSSIIFFQTEYFHTSYSSPHS